MSDPPVKAIDLLHMTILLVAYRSGGATAVAAVEVEANSILNIVNGGRPQNHFGLLYRVFCSGYQSLGWIGFQEPEPAPATTYLTGMTGRG